METIIVVVFILGYTTELQNFLTNNCQGNPEYSNLPRKWNTAVAGAKDNFLLHNDIVFHPVERDGEMGFGVWIGGVLSSQINAGSGATMVSAISAPKAASVSIWTWLVMMNSETK